MGRALTAAGVAHDVKEYPEAGHSFLNDHNNFLFKMMKVIGIGYHAPSASMPAVLSSLSSIR